MSLLVIAAVVSIASIAPPKVVPASAPAGEFSAERAMDHVRAITRAPHPVGTAAHQEVQQYIETVLRGLDLHPLSFLAPGATQFAGHIVSANVLNIVATLPGTRAGRRAVLLATHYDSVPQSYGASDAGSGVATLLETARALRAGPSPDNDIVFLLTDGEELGLIGAQAFVDGPKVAYRQVANLDVANVGVVLNFEARGNHGAVAMFDTSRDAGALIRHFAEAVPYPTASSFISALAQALPNDTDATIFKQAGMPVLGFAYADGLQHYHHHTDSIRTIDPRSVQHDGSYALSLARHFGAANLDALRAPDVVYFDLFNRQVVQYSSRFARIAACLSLVALAIVLWRARRHGLGVGPVAGMIGFILATLLVACLAVSLTGACILGLVGFYRAATYDNVFRWHGVLLAAAAVLVCGGLAVRKGNERELAAASLVLWAIGLGAAALLAPSVSAELQWPFVFALLGSAVWLTRAVGETPLLRALRYVGLVPAAVMTSRVVYSVMVATGATVPALPVAFVVLLGFLLVPAWIAFDAAWLFRTSAAFGAASLAMALIGLAWCQWKCTEPVTDSLVYAIDSDTGAAHWVTFDADVSPWMRVLFPGGSRRAPWPAFSRAMTPVLQASAPLLPYPTPELEVDADETTDSGRRLALRVSAPFEARCVRLWQIGGPPIVDTQIDHRPIHPIVRFSPETDEKLFRWVTGDQSRPAWHMEHCGVGPGFTVALTIAGKGPVELQLVQEYDFLPQRLLSGHIRPEWFVPSQESDTTLIARSFTR